MKKREGNIRYITTTIEIREDLADYARRQRLNKREILEKALLALTTPEDLAYAETVRLQKELEAKQKVLEEANKTEGVKI